MRIFLTGATGVIGRRVLPLLVLDHSVTAVVHRPHSRAEIERAGAVPVQVERLSQYGRVIGFGDYSRRRSRSTIEESLG